MFPLIVASALLAVALAGTREASGVVTGRDLGRGRPQGLFPDSDDLEAGQLDLGFPRLSRTFREEVDEDANPDDLSLLYLMEVTSETPIYTIEDSNHDLLLMASTDLDKVQEVFDDHKGSDSMWENVTLWKYEELPSIVVFRILEWIRSTVTDGDEEKALLNNAVRKFGAKHEWVDSFDMGEDSPFSEWYDEAKEREREMRFPELVGEDLKPGTYFWIGTDDPDTWDDQIGDIVPDEFEEGIVMVSDRDDLDNYDARVVDEGFKKPTHLVKLKLNRAVSTYFDGPFRIGIRDQRHGLRDLSRLLETSIDLDKIDHEAIMAALSEHANDNPLVVEVDYQGGVIVFLPEISEDLEVVEVVPYRPKSR